MEAEDAEARFLQSQKNRTEYLHEKFTRHRRAEEINVFAKSVKHSLSRWNSQLEDLTEKYPIAASSEADKRAASIEIRKLQESLRRLRKHCLSTVDLINTHEETIDLPALPEELPLADIRLLHTEFTNHERQLDLVHKQILPKGKFLFRRYREAKALHQQKPSSLPVTAPSNENDQLVASIATDANLAFLGNRALHSIKNMSVATTAEGDVLLIRGTDVSEDSDVDALKAPTVLYNIQRCHVELHHQLDTLHLVGIKESTIRIMQPVRGAVHVTDCDGVELYVKSQQLRLHTSTHLKCYIRVSAGAILEDCHNIQFFTPEGDLEIKDFNWLRTGLNSPNYTVVMRDWPSSFCVGQKESEFVTCEKIDSPSGFAPSPSVSSFAPVDEGPFIPQRELTEKDVESEEDDEL
jgi:hypothetical protein